MIPYSNSLVLDNNFGILKTEAVFGFKKNDGLLDSDVGYNDTGNLEWLVAPGGDEGRSLIDKTKTKTLPNQKSITKKKKQQQKIESKSVKKIKKKIRKRTGKKKCIVKFMDKGNKLKKSRRKGKYKFHKKFFIPIVMGLMAAKSLLVPVALKALAFISAKGFLMAFFSTILASFLSLKGMFDHSHRYADRKDDSKTQVEIIQVPSRDEHYYEDHFRRADYPYAVPIDIHQ